MAIVLEVSLTLNPGNQIAYLADDTGLVVGTEYVIAGTHIAADTRFTYNGNLDIVLTKQPIAVPTNNFVTPVSINTVPTAAPAPPVATYPYSVKNQLAASGLNLDLEFSPGLVPPKSALGGAGKFKYWVDTSTTIPSLRQCIVPRASTTYVAAEWILLGTIDAAAHKFHFNGDVVDFVGGGGTSNVFNVTNLAVSGASNLTTLNVTGGSTLTTLNVTGPTAISSTLNVAGATTLSSSLNVTGTTTLGTLNAGATALGSLNVSGAATLSGGLTVPAFGISYGANHFSFTWDGHVQTWVDGGHYGTVPSSLPVPIGEGGTSASSAGQALANLGGFPNSGGTLNGGLVAIYISSTGNLDVSGHIGVGGGADITGNINTNTLHVSGSIDGGTTIHGNILQAGDATLSFGPGGAGRILQMANGWYWEWNAGNGDLIWGGPSGAGFWVIRYSDRYCGNQIGPVFGNGAYINFSDVRGKTDIAPANQGLAEILKLKPVTFKRVDQDRTELGFTAQDVQEILPEAVWPLGDSDFGVSLDPIVATLVSAVQQLAARLEALEGA